VFQKLASTQSIPLVYKLDSFWFEVQCAIDGDYAARLCCAFIRKKFVKILGLTHHFGGLMISAIQNARLTKQLRELYLVATLTHSRPSVQIAPRPRCSTLFAKLYNRLQANVSAGLRSMRLFKSFCLQSAYTCKNDQVSNVRVWESTPDKILACFENCGIWKNGDSECQEKMQLFFCAMTMKMSAPP